jgi:hypothetical protein
VDGLATALARVGATLRTEPQPVKGLTLFRSVLSPRGSVYTALAVWPAGGRA